MNATIYCHIGSLNSRTTGIAISDIINYSGYVWFGARHIDVRYGEINLINYDYDVNDRTIKLWLYNAGSNTIVYSNEPFMSAIFIRTF